MSCLLSVQYSHLFAFRLSTVSTSILSTSILGPPLLSQTRPHQVVNAVFQVRVPTAFAAEVLLAHQSGIAVMVSPPFETTYDKHGADSIQAQAIVGPPAYLIVMQQLSVVSMQLFPILLVL